MAITDGAADWQDPPEIRLERVQADGLLKIHQPRSLGRLPAPWSEARQHSEVMLELKLPGNHLDRPIIERALLRRQARQLQRLEHDDPRWLGDEPLWLVAPHVPNWLAKKHRPQSHARGCYWVEERWQTFLWIAANELPLMDELIPFLMVRSGKAQAEFFTWVLHRRPPEWMNNMIKTVDMASRSHRDLLRKLGKTGDPVVDAREEMFLRMLLQAHPEAKQELLKQGQEQGQLTQLRASVRHFLSRRQLVPTQAQDARIEACSDLATLQRWLDQAIDASTVAEALQ